MAGFFGVDLGTTNSVVSFAQSAIGMKAKVFPLLNTQDDRPHPSVVWYEGSEPIVGRRALDQMPQLGLGIFGDVVRSPKMYLGSRHPLDVGGQPRFASDIVGDLLKFLADDARANGAAAGIDLSRAVFTIPVSMNGEARRDLRVAAMMADIRVAQFVHEPLAALYGYLRTMPDAASEVARLEKRLMLVFDWGGGTLDLTLCTIRQSQLLQIENLGDATVGGDRFDERLRGWVREEHTRRYPQMDWSRLQPSAEARLLKACEDTKIALTRHSKSTVYVQSIVAADGPEKTLSIEVRPEQLREVTRELLQRGIGCIRQLLESVGVPIEAIEFCLATGGMVQMPAVREALIEYVGASRLRTVENSATIISEGAAWIAYDQVAVSLAKPLEVQLAGEHYVPVFASGTTLPNEGETIQCPLSVYCVDPRDGVAKCQFARPNWPGPAAPGTDRKPFGYLTVPVDPHASPLRERIEVNVMIDEDLVATIEASSSLRGGHASLEVVDLEFGLRLPHGDVLQEPPANGVGATASSHPDSLQGLQFGDVRLRSNITPDSADWPSVPGDAAEGHLPQHRMTPLQREELMYYKPCGECGRTIDRILEEGCRPCAGRGRARSPEVAAMCYRGHSGLSSKSIWADYAAET